MFCRLTSKGLALFAKLTLAFAILISSAVHSSGQRELRVKRWTTDDGLPQHRPGCFKQTLDGYLWMGTYYGLVRFNGLDFTVFNQFNTPELEDTINALDETADGTLWIGTGAGLVKYRDHSFYRFTEREDLPIQKIWRLAASRTGGVWVQAQNTVFKFENGKKSKVWKFATPGSQIRELQEDKDGWLSLMLDYTWIKISPDGTRSVTNYVKEVSAGWWMCGRLANAPDSLWIGGVGFLELVTAGVARHIPRPGREHIPVSALYEDKTGNLWVGDLEGRMHVWDGQRWKSIDFGEGARPPSIITIKEDQEGSLWVGNARGLFQIQKLRVRTFTKENGLPDDFIYSVCTDTNNFIWVATVQGVSRIQNNRVVPFESVEPFVTSRDRNVWPNGKGGLFFGKEKFGLYEFQDGTFTLRASETNFGGSIVSLYRDPSGLLWVGSSTTVASFEDGKVTPLVPSFPTNNIRCMLQDHEKNFWLGTKNNGLIRVQGTNLTYFKVADGLADNSVWSIYEDANGSIWIGTENGLARWRNGKFFKFTRHHGVGDNFVHRRGSKRLQAEETLVINCILEDDLGFLWLSGMRGLVRIERAQLDAVAENRLHEVDCAIINSVDGMESSETNGEYQPSGWKAENGTLWFPSTLGLVEVDPQKFKDRLPPPIQMEQVLADEEILYGDFADPSPSVRGTKPGTLSNKIHLAAGHAKVIEFHFTANTMVDAKHARFRYRLKDSDADWGPVTTDRIARYTNLQPGDHVFEVTATDNSGIWNSEPARVEFSIAPHFWETWAFYILCGCGSIGVAAGIQAYRLRWQRRLLKLEEQRALANERARIARDLHDDLGTALTGLALELDVTGKAAKAESGITERLSETARHTREMAERMREVVWSVNPKCDTLSSLAGFLEQQVSQFLRTDTIAARVEFPENIPALPLGADTRHQLALSVREALTNVVRHAQASEVVLSLAITDHELIVQVKDNGKGFQPRNNGGHGLENMKERLSQIGGTFECVSDQRTGTIVSFRLPLAESFQGVS
jgi:ligand-binding sensor domain-containing protein/two-component sensor histidine kinase